MSTYLGADFSKYLSLPSMPDKIGPFKTSDLIGYSTVLSIAMTAYIIVRKSRHKARRKARR